MRSASRALPIPPGPVSVSKQELASRSQSSAIAWSRPTKPPRSLGRLVYLALSEVSGGKAARNNDLSTVRRGQQSGAMVRRRAVIIAHAQVGLTRI